MKAKQILLSAILIISLINNSQSEELFQNVRGKIEGLVAEKHVPSIAVAVARDGKIIWEEGFGLADRERNIPASAHTIYCYASISKTLLSTGLMVLVEKKLIDLDRPINEYLGKTKLKAWVGNAEEATVRRVADHTAGLPTYYNFFYEDESYQPPPREETIHKYGIMVTPPGEHYEYSNLGFGILDHLISRVSGKNYADFMREEVFVPLGMTHTSVGIMPEHKDLLATMYAPDGSALPFFRLDTPGAGETYGSVHDLILYAMFHLKTLLPHQKAIISDAAIEEMRRPTAQHPVAGVGISLGWGVLKGGDDLLLLGADGGAVGIRTILYLVPRENIAIAVLSNTNTRKPDEIAFEILGTLLPGKLSGLLALLASAKAGEKSFIPAEELIGIWKGNIHFDKKRIPVVLEVQKSGQIYANLNNQTRIMVSDINYQSDFLGVFKSAGGGPFLRGSFKGDLRTEDTLRHPPDRLWFELKLRGNILNGSLLAVYSTPTRMGYILPHYVELRKI
jgi:CubicO group peptidase (beta-lactamase class C family)